MRQKCCGQPLIYDKNVDTYSCGNCAGVISGAAARSSEDPAEIHPDVLRAIEVANNGRRADETDNEYRARLKSDAAFVQKSPLEDNLTNTVLRKMVLDRDASLLTMKRKIAALQKRVDTTGDVK